MSTRDRGNLSRRDVKIVATIVKTLMEGMLGQAEIASREKLGSETSAMISWLAGSTNTAGAIKTLSTYEDGKFAHLILPVCDAIQGMTDKTMSEFGMMTIIEENNIEP